MRMKTKKLKVLAVQAQAPAEKLNAKELCILRDISHSPIPHQYVEKMLASRFVADGLVECIMLSNPMHGSDGGLIPFLRITSKGMTACALKAA